MQVYGLVGNPVGHSLSPPMHEAAYEETGLDARYVTFEPARDDIAAAVEGADALGVSGLNVTIPFKQDVLELVDPDPLAAAGAVTIDGAWMLLLQGVEAFERWTGRDAPVDAMNAALRSHLESD